MPKLFDTHCHLIHKNYKKSLEEVIKSAEEAGVDLFLHIGTSLKENEQAIELAEKHNNIFCSIGIYPHDDKDVSLKDLEIGLRKQLSQSNKIKAIGETGIDVSSWQGGRSIDEQAALFEMQIKLAVEFGLPLIIHNRNGDEQVLTVVEKYAKQGLTGVCHCFVQDWDYAQKMLDFGFYLTFGGIITYDSGKDILETVKKCPKDRILVETDSPWLAPGDLRRSVNEPKNIVMVAQKIADTRQISYDEVCKLTYENGKTIFEIDR